MKPIACAAFAFLVCGTAYAQKSSADAAACDRLAASLKLTSAKVTSSHAVAAGHFVPPGAAGGTAANAFADLRAFCRVELTLTPSADSDIKSEVWLPASGWNGKFQQVGNGAWAGSIFPGLEPGSELNWTGPAGGPEPLAVSGDLFKYVVFKDPNWDFRTFDLVRDYDVVHKIDSLALSPTSADLKAFVARGGKLLIYQGWADMNVAPRSTVNYYDQLVKAIGRKPVDDSVRLFLAPGMAHCGGGEGPNVFDALTPLEQWREQGKAPTSILATHSTNGKVDRTRPLCPYPQVAKYTGSGSIDKAENFVCAQ